MFGISEVVCERSAGAASTAASIARSRAALGSVAADWARSGKSSAGNDIAYWIQDLVSQPRAQKTVPESSHLLGLVWEEENIILRRSGLRRIKMGHPW
jgi:hypothetical protein